MNLTSTNEAALICANLLRQGYVRKSDFPQLEVNEQLLISVRDRLQDVGMELIMNSYSSFYAVKLVRETQDTIEESNNIGLKNNEVAMLVILWSKLILPKRAVHDPSANNGEITIDSENQENPEEENEDATEDPENKTSKKASKSNKKSSKQENRIFVELNELHAEFGKHFGSKTAFKSTLTRLANLKFIYMHNEVIAEGVFLDLLIDGYQMGNEIKKSALAYKLAGLSEDDMDEWDDLSEEDEEDFSEEDIVDLSDELVISQTQIIKDEE